MKYQFFSYKLPNMAVHRTIQWLTLLLVCLALGIISPAYAQEESYVVQPGDTLSEIAKAHGTDTETLRRLNGLGDVDFVWVGQRLFLPVVSATDGTNADAISESQPIEATDTDVSTISASDSVADDKVIGDKVTGDVAVDEAAGSDEQPANDVTATPTPTSTPEPTIPPTFTPTRTPTFTPTPGVPGATTGLSTPMVSSLEKSGIHIIQEGETLSKVAVRYQTTLAHLIEFNQISPAQRLHVGQALVVPIAGDAIGADASVEPVEHIVQSGEYLSTIAKQYDVSVTALAQANGILNSGLIVPGQRLMIPTETDLMAIDSFDMGRDGYHVHTEFPTLTEKWIDVDLSEQRLIAYRGRKPIRSFLISSGLPGTPTVTGIFRIWAKTPLQDMYAGNRAAGYSYYIKDVPWVQYFYKDYGFHAAPWHNNFGHPMSHGCINLRVDDAEWLFRWASPIMDAPFGWFISDDDYPGTLVVVHE